MIERAHVPLTSVHYGSLSLSSTNDFSIIVKEGSKDAQKRSDRKT